MKALNTFALGVFALVGISAANAQTSGQPTPPEGGRQPGAQGQTSPQGTSGTSSTQSATASSNAAKPITGCIQKGASADEFTLQAKDGNTYKLQSTTTKLDPHVGHTVTVMGSMRAA